MQHFSKANRPSILVLALSLWFDVTCVVLQALREKNLPTIPSTIGEELTFNPFMRVQWVITWTECCTFTINITYRNACQWSIQSTMNLPTLHIPPPPPHTHLPQGTQCPAACQILRCSGHHDVPSGGEEQLQAQTVTVNSLCCSFWWFSHYHWFAVRKLPAISLVYQLRVHLIQHSVSCCKLWASLKLRSWPSHWGAKFQLLSLSSLYHVWLLTSSVRFIFANFCASRDPTLSLGRDAKLLTHQIHKVIDSIGLLQYCTNPALWLHHQLRNYPLRGTHIMRVTLHAQIYSWIATVYACIMHIDS